MKQKHKLLIIGGTNFIGRNLINALLKLNQFEITLFNRGITNPDLFPQINRIKGDRETDDILKIREEDWDYIIDLSCYFPASLGKTIEGLNANLKRYVFISTCSVYEDKNTDILKKETAPIKSCTPEQALEPNMYKHYGEKKAACEQLLEQSNLDYLILRPPLVYGPYDHTDRLYYWLYQVKMKKKILLPDNGERLFSIVFVQDLVNTIIQSLQIQQHSNIYTVSSTPQLSIQKIVSAASKILKKNPSYVNAPPKFLLDRKINQWTDMPLWINSDYFTYSNEKLLQDFDLELTDFQEGTKTTIEYYNERGWDEPIYGMKEETRLELINNL